MSKTVSGKEVIDLIERAEAVIIMDDNRGLCYASVDGDGDLWSIDIIYDDGEQLWEYNFKVWNGDGIEVRDNQVFLMDSDTNELVGIKLLEVTKL